MHFDLDVSFSSKTVKTFNFSFYYNTLKFDSPYQKTFSTRSAFPQFLLIFFNHLISIVHSFRKTIKICSRKKYPSLIFLFSFYSHPPSNPRVSTSTTTFENDDFKFQFFWGEIYQINGKKYKPQKRSWCLLGVCALMIQLPE